MSARRRGEIGLLSLVAILFFNVSGGPYGLEDAVGTLGPGLALVLLLVTPLVWSLPVSLAMAELAAALPEEGGYVVWVQRAFGRFWSFQVGWWSWINSFVDVAVYPALFADYVGFWRPDMSPLERWALVLAFIWILTAINLAGRAHHRAGSRWRWRRSRSCPWSCSPRSRARSSERCRGARSPRRRGASSPGSAWGSRS